MLWKTGRVEHSLGQNVEILDKIIGNPRAQGSNYRKIFAFEHEIEFSHEL